MKKVYSEEDVTWASIEKYINYSSVRWTVDKNGMPVYIFLDENGKKMGIIYLLAINSTNE